MRWKNLPLVIIALFFCSLTQAAPFGSWAARGMVVKKTFRATPLSHSLGVEGIYRLELRDAKNRLRRQMVTRAVYLAYEIGDDFNELVPPPSPEARELAKVKQAVRETIAEVNEPENRNRVASVNFPQEMLPETEGF
ncbi:MAG: hypothetical protein M3Q46_10445 [Verrucomicrobiota bacterium]|nr:hypothetical protein [Verrucomicrobiota bacterium]